MDKILLLTKPRVIKKHFLFFISFLFFVNTPFILFAQKTASVSGNWNDTTTWGGQPVPTSSESVVINSGITVTLQSDLVLNNTITINSNAILELNGYHANIFVLAGTGRIRTSAGSSTLTIGSSSASSFSGIIGPGNISLVKIGSGTLTLGGNNTYEGITSIESGIVNIRHANALGATTSGTIVANGAQLQLQQNVFVGAEELTINGLGVSNTGALRSMTGSVNTFGGKINLASNSSIVSDLFLILNAEEAISGNFSLVFSGNGSFQVESGISLGVSLTKSGNGSCALTGADGKTIPDTLLVENGELQIAGLADLQEVEVSNGASINILEGADIKIKGNLTINGSMDAQTNPNTITFNGASQSIPVPTSGDKTGYHHLKIEQTSGNASLIGNTQIGGTLTLTSGNLNVGSNTLSLYGNYFEGDLGLLNAVQTSSLELRNTEGGT